MLPSMIFFTTEIAQISWRPRRLRRPASYNLCHPHPWEVATCKVQMATQIMGKDIKIRNFDILRIQVPIPNWQIFLGCLMLSISYSWLPNKRVATRRCILTNLPRLPTEQKIAGSSPTVLEELIFWHSLFQTRHSGSDTTSYICIARKIISRRGEKVQLVIKRNHQSFWLVCLSHLKLATPSIPRTIQRSLQIPPQNSTKCKNIGLLIL